MRLSNLVFTSIALSLALCAQDTFSSNSGEPCAQELAAEKALHTRNQAELQERDLDIQNQSRRDRAMCRNADCQTSAARKHDEALRDLYLAREDEQTRHLKAESRIRANCTAGTSAPVTRAGLVNLTIDDVKQFLIKKMIPGPGNSVPINGQFVGKLAFLRLTPVLLSGLVDELNQTTNKIIGLRSSKGNQAELNRLTSYAATIQKTIRELRVSYDTIRGELTSMEAANFPPSSELNFPY